MYDKTIFFFSLGKALSERYTELDEHTVLSFVKNNKKTLEEYERYGGWESIKNVMALANVKNTDAYVDDLRLLYSKGILENNCLSFRFMIV